MPRFPYLRSSKGEEQRGNDEGDSSQDAEEKVQRRHFKRDFIRKLLNLTDSRGGRRRDSKLQTSPSLPPPTKSPSPPTSPMDKPLPPPPPPGTGIEPLPTAIPPTLKLERIMTPIALPALHKLFSGAPQFFSRNEGHYTGAPHPSVAFPWDTDVAIRDVTDHMKIHDEAWSCVTAWPHVTVNGRRTSEARISHEKSAAHFLPRCRERPNMLSMQGLERGTTGFQAALELGVADALLPDDAFNHNPEDLAEARGNFMDSKDGLRSVPETVLIERLLAVNRAYHDGSNKHQQSSGELHNTTLYSELFTQLLYPPSRVTPNQDPTGLQVQVEALMSVLADPVVWTNFALVEWRIRLGMILWGTDQYEISVNNEVLREQNPRYWLLLQILLSCELLVRLDAISMNIEHGVEVPGPSDEDRFDKLANPSIKWSLLLARAWLENISVQEVDPEILVEVKPAGWLATLTGAAVPQTVIKDGLASLRFRGRHQARQVAGLVHFAQKLAWPGLEELKVKMSADRIQVADSVQNTPIGTPMSMLSNGSNSYFSSKKKPQLQRGMSARMAAIIQPAGWLSNSYISGLILPGEGLSHFLISTLLEQDSAAVSRLGEEANLYGGFVYSGRSFWSTSCILGKVLAAAKGATQCMGWVSSEIVPQSTDEGWVDIITEPVTASSSDKKRSKPQLWQKHTVERNGSIAGGADISSVLPGEFVLPSDESKLPPPSVTLQSLVFHPPLDSLDDTPEQTPISTPLTDVSSVSTIRAYRAAMRFTVEIDSGEEKMEICLLHDVNFVTAHPCISTLCNDSLNLPSQNPLHGDAEETTLPTASVSSSTGSTYTLAHEHMNNSPHGHPLHKAFTYTKIPLSSLLATPSSTPLSSLLTPPMSPTTSSKESTSPGPPSPNPLKFDQTQSSTHSTSSNIPKVLVVDCTDIDSPSFKISEMGMGGTGEDGRKRPMPTPHVYSKRRDFGSDTEVLARAVCSERGWNALVSRRGRGCLGCAIREAGALGWRVVLRVA